MDGILSSMGSLFDKKESSNPTPKTSIAQQPSDPKGDAVPTTRTATGSATAPNTATSSSDTNTTSAEATKPKAIDPNNIDLKSINFKNMGSKKTGLNNSDRTDTRIDSNTIAPKAAVPNTTRSSTSIESSETKSANIADSYSVATPDTAATKAFEPKPSTASMATNASGTATTPTKQYSTPVKNTSSSTIGIQDMKAQTSTSFTPSTPSTPASNNGPSGVAQDENRPSAVIGSKITFKGELSGDEDLLIQGIVEGTVSLKGNQLTVGKLGKVKANLSAKNIIVDGNVEGDLIAEDHIAINASSVVKGNIVAERVTLEDGAKFRGSIDMDTDTPLSSKPQGFSKNLSYTDS
ncbi:bactofilin family protein [Marinagarivorans algicola]|uniref:bactofilin family protein n=1 Tax=Marinagarivorans algicola TaxID=1513270 RepID=UPI0006B9BC5B|nr:polymer-forming cytoskeletal protein [Marinagarivorans algicola]